MVKKTNEHLWEFDDVVERKKFLLSQKLDWMAKQGYFIWSILEEKKKIEWEENIVLSKYIREKIISSMLLYTIYTLWNVDDVIDQVKDIKKELVAINVNFEITDSVKKNITYGIINYRHYSRFPKAKDSFKKDIQKLKINWLYLEDEIQTVTDWISNDIKWAMFLK